MTLALITHTQLTRRNNLKISRCVQCAKNLEREKGEDLTHKISLLSSITDYYTGVMIYRTVDSMTLTVPGVRIHNGLINRKVWSPTRLSLSGEVYPSY